MIEYIIQEQDKSESMEKKIYNLIILDESGSMHLIKPQAISGLNETLQTIKAAQEKYDSQNHYVTLVTFNSDKVKTIYDCCPANRIQELSNNDYQPNAATPLFDVIGISLTRLNEEVEDEDKVLVTIITDGYENASREYSGKAIFQLIEGLKVKGWIFTYIGANQDVEKVAASMGIRNSLLFDASPEGTEVMFKEESKCRDLLYCCIDEENDIADKDFFESLRKHHSPNKSLDKKVEKKKNKWWPF